MEQIITQIGIGLLSGLSISAAGYFKSSGAETFEAEKFLKTIILGGIVGGIVVMTGMTPDIIIGLPIYAGLTTLIDNILKGIKRKLWGN